jgi:citronellol/citronellal dehydrogenase
MSYASVFAPNLFASKVVIVTGGGSGIGRCVAHELAALGATVALVGRKVEKLQKVADEITQDGGSVSFQVSSRPWRLSWPSMAWCTAWSTTPVASL